MNRPLKPGDPRNALSIGAREVGDMLARRIFKERGNNSEVHLTEPELALIAGMAADIAFDLKVCR
jgi:hypothetical protein